MPIRLLFSPLNYLRIKLEAKPWFDIFYPLFLSVGVLIVFIVLPFDIFGENGFVKSVSQILQILAGFYIAALAAVATFNRPDIDKPLAGNPAKLSVYRKGLQGISVLTRRQFVCYLFGYLAWTCLFLYFVSIFCVLLKPNIVELINNDALLIVLKHLFLLFYVLMLSNILVTTMFGLHYLSDRLHRP